MISVEEHLAEILAAVRPVESVELLLAAAHGLVLADDVRSGVDLPRFDNSAMDGYAVRCVDVTGASEEHPVSLPVVGDLPAGDTTHRVQPDGAVWRIMTGAPLPEGADAVVPVEDTDGDARQVRIRRSAEPGRHVRRAGSDLRVGDVVAAAGTPVRSAQLAALVSAGSTHVRVTRPVQVVVLSTGDELVPLGEPVRTGQILDSNGPMLAAAVIEAGHRLLHMGHLPDDEEVIARELARHLEAADAVVTTGGVSKGAYDLVKAVLSREGAMRFTEVAMQPGKPQGFGVLGERRVPVFTLPGNPVSALVSFEVFVRPALAVMAARPHLPLNLTARVATGWTAPAGKEQYARVVVGTDGAGGYAVRPAGGPGSYLTGGLAGADALAVVPAEVTEVAVGSLVAIRPLAPWEEIAGRAEGQSWS